MKYIRKFNSDSLEFSTGKTVPVSRRRISEIKEAFSKYMVMKYKR
jgi:DNA-binding LytR/AlgR family response regulator